MGSKLYQQRQETLEMDQMNLLYDGLHPPTKGVTCFTKLDAPKRFQKRIRIFFVLFWNIKASGSSKDVYSFGVKGNAVKI